jgi:hypothetical protein
MCLIIDANVVHKVFLHPTADFAPVERALTNGYARIVYGGKLTKEYLRIERFQRILLRLDQQGGARQVSDALVDAETKKVIQSGQCVSDDPHIIALALVGQVRLLCSEDGNLETDFTNSALVGRPKGNIYKRSEHAHLIKKHCAKAKREK